MVVSLVGDKLRATVSNTVDNTEHRLEYPVPKSLLGKWVSVVYSYDAPSKELELYVVGTLVARERCTVTPMVDRPMPIFVGGGNQNYARFTGKVKSVALWNR